MSTAFAMSTGNALEGYTVYIGASARDSELPPAPSVPRNTDLFPEWEDGLNVTFATKYNTSVLASHTHRIYIFYLRFNFR